ncbi:MAG: transcriptional repressor [Bacilli bacterium]|jgi:Fe2+ or Zn2+ uptake regulation protein|nr:transcriptional repressor [Bacilli bacterium]
MALRHTKQKEFVSRFLEASFSHPTAYDVALAAKEEGISLGITSAYRILNSLVEEGKAVKVPSVDGMVHFDFKRDDDKSHIHFVCQKCGRIFDLREEKSFASFLQADKRFQIGSLQDIIIYGICEDCQKKK